VIPAVLRSCCTAVAALGLALLVAGCTHKPEPACPEGVIPIDASRITVFRDGSGRDLTDVLSAGNIQNILIQCRYDKNAVDIYNFQIAMTADRGAADRSKAADYEYWVAIVDPDRKILVRKTYNQHFDFAGNLTHVGVVASDFELRIPMKDVMKAPDYQIIVGFQLTPDQLAWNRSQRGKREQDQ
jgi:hypothetical protein